MNFSGLVVIIIALTMLGGCTASGPARQTATAGSEEACIWLVVPLGLKMTRPADGVDPMLLEAAVSGSLTGVNEPCEDIGGLTSLQVLAGVLDDRELPVIRHLLMQGADVNLPIAPNPEYAQGNSAPYYLGGTSLHLAAGEGTQRAAMIEMLVDSGGNIAARTDSGATPLHLAAASGDLHMVEVLLERGSDGNARDTRGWTPLHYSAAEGSSADILIALLDLGGADPEITTNLGQTAHDLILENPDLEGSEAARLLEVR